jgi:hypothetical protein
MAYSEKEKAKIKAEFEAGLDSQGKICQKWRMSRNTLKKFAKDEGWIYGKNDRELTHTINKSATSKIIESKTHELENFTVDHISAIKNIATLTKATISRLGSRVKETMNKVDRAESEAIFSQQKFLKIASETLDTCYKSQKSALGLDEKKESEINVQVNNERLPDIKIIGVSPDSPAPE